MQLSSRRFFKFSKLFYVLLVLVAFPPALIAIGLATGWIVSFDVPGFKPFASSATLKGRAFTGVAYELHGGRSLARLAFFLDGKQFGTERRWHPNGAKSFEAEYVNGLPHGKHRYWYPDGKAQYLKNYVNGLEHGEFWGWHPNGQLSDFRFFEQGEERVYKSWTAAGKPFYNYVYQAGAPVGVKGGEFCKSKNIVFN